MGDLANKFLLGFRKLRFRNTSTVTRLRTIPDRTCDQEMALRPPRRFVCDFPLRGRVSHSQKLFDPVEWLLVPTWNTLSVFFLECVTTSLLRPAPLSAPLRLAGASLPALFRCTLHRP